MQILKKLFRKNEVPVDSFEVEGVGTFSWNDEEEYWESLYLGHKISVSYDGFSNPIPELVKDLKNTLLNNEFPSDILNLVLEQAKSESSAMPELEPKDIIFQKPGFILIQFFGPDDHEPFWFAELHGDKVFIGCDT